MQIKAYILAIPSRNKELGETLARWSKTDWPERPTVCMQPSHWPVETMAQRWKATADNSLELLSKAYHEKADYVLFTEDDVEPNLNLWWNLNNWPPMVWNQLKAGCLYTPNVIIDPFKPTIEETEENLHQTARVSYKLNYRLHKPMNGPTPTHVMWGSQAYVFSHEFCGTLIEKWHKVGGGQDARVIQITNRLNVPIIYHLPDLFEHHGCVKLNQFTDRQHKSMDFDLNWKALPVLKGLQYPMEEFPELSMAEAELYCRRMGADWVSKGGCNFSSMRDQIETMVSFVPKGSRICFHGYGTTNRDVTLAIDAAAYRYRWERIERVESLIFFRVP